MDSDFDTDPLGQDEQGNDVFLGTSGLHDEDVEATIQSSLSRDLFEKDYADVFAGDERWQGLDNPGWRHLRLGCRFDLCSQACRIRRDAQGAGPRLRHSGRVPLLGDSVTTDHISLAGSDREGRQPAGRYLADHGGSARLTLWLTPRQPRGHDPRHFRQHPPAQPAAQRCRGWFHRRSSTATASVGDQTTIYDASAAYQAAGCPARGARRQGVRLGSSRDWAAKARWLGSRRSSLSPTSGSTAQPHRHGRAAAESPKGESATSLGLTGEETFTITGVEALNEGTTPKTVKVHAEVPRADRVRRGRAHRHPG